MPDRVLRVCALYPDLMNIYADRGNLLLLERRCAWRGIGFALTGVGLGDEVAPGELEAEGEAAGLRRAGVRLVEATADHVGSEVVLLRG